MTDPRKSVWITRAQPGAAATAERVRALGHEPLVAPLLAVRLLEGAAVDLDGVAALDREQPEESCLAGVEPAAPAAPAWPAVPPAPPIAPPLPPLPAPPIPSGRHRLQAYSIVVTPPSGPGTERVQVVITQAPG